MSELKPCSCGKTPEITRNAKLGVGFIVECDCGLKLYYSKAGYGFKTEKQAASAWNLRAQPANEPLVRCGECVKYQTRDCAAQHEQALTDYCSHGVRKPGGEQDGGDHT